MSADNAKALRDFLYYTKPLWNHTYALTHWSSYKGLELVFDRDKPSLTVTILNAEGLVSKEFEALEVLGNGFTVKAETLDQSEEVAKSLMDWGQTYRESGSNSVLQIKFATKVDRHDQDFTEYRLELICSDGSVLRDKVSSDRDFSGYAKGMINSLEDADHGFTGTEANVSLKRLFGDLKATTAIQESDEWLDHHRTVSLAKDGSMVLSPGQTVANPDLKLVEVQINATTFFSDKRETYTGKAPVLRDSGTFRVIVNAAVKTMVKHGLTRKTPARLFFLDSGKLAILSGDFFGIVP
jgi:hypothetical protein